MLGRILTAEIGRRLAGPDKGLTGALIGAAAPWLVRRAFTPIGAAIIGGLIAKRVYDRRKERQNTPPA